MQILLETFFAEPTTTQFDVRSLKTPNVKLFPAQKIHLCRFWKTLEALSRLDISIHTFMLKHIIKNVND